MSYAPNDPYSSQGGGAAVGLLARKGQACPAVDAAAHEGVDFAFSAAASQGQAAYAIHPNAADHFADPENAADVDDPSASSFPSAPVVDAVFEPAEHPSSPANSNAPAKGPSAAVLYLPAPTQPAKAPIVAEEAAAPAFSVIETPPAPDIVSDAQAAARESEPEKPVKRSKKGGGDGPATVALRISRSDLNRIKELAQDFGISPRTVIADALECYLQANEEL